MISKIGFWNSDTNTFDYAIKLTQGWNTQLGDGDGSAGRPLVPPILIDEFDSHLEFVPGSMKVRRTETLYETASESLKANFDSVTRGVFSITDQVDVDEQNDKWTFNFGKIANNYGSGSGWVFPNPEIKGNWYNGWPWWIDSGSSYVITYSLKFKDGDAGKYTTDENGEAKFHNVAKLQVFTDGKPSFWYRAGETVTYRPLSKTMSYTGGVSADVEILINPSGEKLAGQGVNTITIYDDMSKNLSLYTTSLSVQTHDGTKWVPENGSVPLENGNLNVPYGYVIHNSQEFTMTLPDQTPIRLTYKVLVEGSTGETVNVSNSVKVTGYADFEDEFRGSFTLSKTSGGGGGSKKTLKVLKRDTNTNNQISGVLFGLYASYKPPDPAVWNRAKFAAESIGAPETKVIDGHTYYFLMYRYTVNGDALFGDNPLEENLIHGVTYALLELETVQGYIKLDEPKLLAIEEHEDGFTVGVDKVGDSTTVYNAPGVKLPETGSTSGLPFVQAGTVIFALAGAVLFITRRRVGDCS